jgi:hypothetical protein
MFKMLARCVKAVVQAAVREAVAEICAEAKQQISVSEERRLALTHKAS